MVEGHFISNVRVRTTDHDEHYDVCSDVLLAAGRQADRPTLLTAERHDLVGHHDDDWRLRRPVILDSSTIQFAHTRVVL